MAIHIASSSVPAAAMRSSLASAAVRDLPGFGAAASAGISTSVATLRAMRSRRWAHVSAWLSVDRSLINELRDNAEPDVRPRGTEVRWAVGAPNAETAWDSMRNEPKAGGATTASAYRNVERRSPAFVIAHRSGKRRRRSRRRRRCRLRWGSAREDRHVADGTRTIASTRVSELARREATRPRTGSSLDRYGAPQARKNAGYVRLWTLAIRTF